MKQISINKSNNFYFLSVLLFSFSALASTTYKVDPYKLQIFIGDDIATYLPFVHELCLKEYRNYPYLYEEAFPGEYYDFLSWYLTSKDGALAIVFNDSEPVGFITGTSLMDFEEHFNGVTRLFKNEEMNAADYYYFGEVIVQKEHRGHFLSKRLFNALEQHGRNLGYQHACFVTESYDTHPSKPKDHREFAGLCVRLGYRKSSVVIPFTWMSIQPEGHSKMQEHLLRFWVKNLNS